MEQTTTTRRVRRAIKVAAVAAAATTGLGAAAWACTPTKGVTTIESPAPNPVTGFPEGPAGSTITVRGDNGEASSNYDLRFKSPTNTAACHHGEIMDIVGDADDKVTSDSGGDIASVNAVIPSTSTAGVARVCFRQVTLGTTMSSAVFVVTL